jgi:hypothetical protein
MLTRPDHTERAQQPNKRGKIESKVKNLLLLTDPANVSGSAILSPRMDK